MKNLVGYYEIVRDYLTDEGLALSSSGRVSAAVFAPRTSSGTSS